MENVKEFKPAYNVTKFSGDFLLSFNLEFGDEFDKVLNDYIESGDRKISPAFFDFLKQLQMVLDCKGRGYLTYHYNTTNDIGNVIEFSLTKQHNLFKVVFNRYLASELDVLFNDILNAQQVSSVIYSFVAKFQNLLNYKKPQVAENQTLYS